MRRRRGASPAVSVVITNYNGGAWLAEALESVLAQTFTDFELLTIDDGSTDGSPELMRSFERRDARLRVVCLPRVGLVAARNRALAEAGAPLIACLDADDIALPGRLERQVGYLAAHSDTGLAASWAQGIDGAGNPLPAARNTALDPRDMRRVLETGNPILHSSIMARTDLLRRLGGYRPAFVVAEDYDLWLRVVEVATIAVLPEVLIKMRVHDGSLSRRNNLRQAFSARLARCSALARRANEADPFDGSTPPPDWTVPPPADAAFARDAALYRWLDATDAGPERDEGWDRSAREALLHELKRLNHCERRLAAESLVARLRAVDLTEARAAKALLFRLFREHPAIVFRAAASLR